MSANEKHNGAKSTLQTNSGPMTYYSLPYLNQIGAVKLDSLPFSIRVILENVLRHADGTLVTEEDLETVLTWSPSSKPGKEFPFMPERVVLQDFTGIPAIVDLVAMRSAMARMGGDPKKVNPLVPVDLVIDHSVQIDFFGSSQAFQMNKTREYERNKERYELLQWAQQAFQNVRVVPPGTGIVHQVNLEYLSSVVANRSGVLFPDTLVGADSHTTMVNGLSVLGWGVGGIEAEAVMLGQPYYMQLPEVVGVRLSGSLREGTTATDLVLTVTERLRAKGVVEKFVEYFGPGLANLALPDKATIANMCPEYGATVGFFPIDDDTISFLRNTGRDHQLVESYAKAQGLFRSVETPDPEFSEIVEIDMDEVVPSLAGPRRPQDRIPLGQVKESFQVALGDLFKKDAQASVSVSLQGQQENLGHGTVAIAAITSCTNTSNPSVMIGAGLMAKRAVERGMSSKPWVKTSMAPGSQVVADYLDTAGLTSYLDQLGFHIVGYGCTTCIGNSGPLPEAVAEAVTENDLVVAAVLSGNRNFEARVHPQVKANYLASPMLVVAYALAGRMDIDLTSEPLTKDQNGDDVYLHDIWPSQQEISNAVSSSLDPEKFASRYGNVFSGDEEWGNLPVPKGDQYTWSETSTYVREVPFFMDLPTEPEPTENILGARALAVLGDSVTTDHISPAGSISPQSPAGQYLISQGVEPRDFNQFGARRGSHEVMVRGTFGNARLRNALTPEKEGDWTIHLPTGEEMRIYDAAMRYQAEGIPLVVFAGKEYGSGSSRDWAAKGPNLLGVKAAIAESYERIHRSNLIGMGVLPLQFKAGESLGTFGLSGNETFNVSGIADDLKPLQDVEITATDAKGATVSFSVTLRIDTNVEVDYYQQGGVLHTVLRRMLSEG